MCFQISTSGAGEGKLVATVEEVVITSKLFKGKFTVEIKKLSPEFYEIQFNPGTMSVCLLTVHTTIITYQAPFKDKSFCEVNQCKASGVGFTTAQAGVWNRLLSLLIMLNQEPPVWY